MFISLNKEEEKILGTENKKEFTPLKKDKRFNTLKEQQIVTLYEEGAPFKEISKTVKVSTGMIYSVINSYKVEKRNKKSKVSERVSHVLDDTEKTKQLIKDYQFMNVKDIYKKYNIHKNGLYYILDLYNVERKTGSKEEVLNDEQEDSEIVVEL
ncbi:transposase domain-containing protein [Staphylococcus phage Twillingate]|nr:transposase domain-containing protein [Staphylococcus phage Quidividi]AXF38598.1 transposase domain-containing protein [Staphylococcus phage Twillingate]